jgi:hypothetical protein
MEKYISQIVTYVLENKVVKATKYVSPKLIIRAVRKRYKGKILGNQNVQITLTIGKPNFLERKFIKDCIKAKEPFPVKKLQIKE